MRPVGWLVLFVLLSLIVGERPLFAKERFVFEKFLLFCPFFMLPCYATTEIGKIATKNHARHVVPLYKSPEKRLDSFFWIEKEISPPLLHCLCFSFFLFSFSFLKLLPGLISHHQSH